MVFLVLENHVYEINLIFILYYSYFFKESSTISKNTSRPEEKYDTSKMTTSMFTSHGNPGSLRFQNPPMLISNKKLFFMMKILTQQVTQQYEGNMTLLKEVEKTRIEIHKPQEAAPSILQPKILNFNST